jgi:hypothetical protein
MFEARGVWHGYSFDSQADRINRGRLADFKHYVATRRLPPVAELVASDRTFKSHPAGAYAEAWALTFYVSEAHSEMYRAYLAKMANKEYGADYPAAERIADFAEFFGHDFRLFEAKFHRFMARVK